MKLEIYYIHIIIERAKEAKPLSTLAEINPLRPIRKALPSMCNNTRVTNTDKIFRLKARSY